MASQVDICNLALRMIGANTITAIDDGSKEADHCSDFWTYILEEVMESYSWGFLKKTRPLNYTTEEFPRLETADDHKPLVKKMVNYLACSVLKVAHHGSMHSAPLDVYEKMKPEIAIVSTEQESSTKNICGLVLTRGLFPHSLAVTALEECDAQILTTDGCYESEKTAAPKKPGSIMVVVPPGGKPRWKKLEDAKEGTPEVLEEV